VGAAISRAGAGRHTPLATATLVLAANAPDVDMVAFTQGPYFALAFRRGVTHGWAALLVLPFVVTALVLAWDRLVRRARRPGADPARAGPTLALAAVGLCTHPALDWMNVYGMRWGAPFDGSWSYGDALFIVDPWIWLALGGSLLLSSRPSRRALAGWSALGLVTSAAVLAAPVESGVKATWCCGVVAGALLARRRRAAPDAGLPGGPHGPGSDVGAPAGHRSLEVGGQDSAPTRWALLATGVYLALMIASGAAASGRVERVARGSGLQVEDVMVAPMPGNPFAAEFEVRTVDAYVPGVHRWLGEPPIELRLDSAVARLSAPAGASATLVRQLVETARRDPRVRDFLIWSRYPYVAVDRADGRWLVRFSDARYDEEPSTGALAGVSVYVEDGGGG
jgi:inner membrane protein